MTQPKISYHVDFSLSKINEADEEYQARLDYDIEEINSLARDIEINGQRNPIGIKQKNDYYQVLYGFQRTKALKKLGKTTAKVNLYEELTDSEAREQAISDNMRNCSLTEKEQAIECFKLKNQGYSIEKLCELFSAKKSVIYNFLSIAEADKATQYCLHKGYISLNHAVELLREKELSKRLEKLRQILIHNWSIRTLKQNGEGTTTKGFPILCPKTMARKEPNDCKDCEFFTGIKTVGYRKLCLEYDPKIKKYLPARKRVLICNATIPTDIKQLFDFKLQKIVNYIPYGNFGKEELEEIIKQHIGSSSQKDFENSDLYREWWDQNEYESTIKELKQFLEEKREQTKIASEKTEEAKTWV